MIPIDIYQQKFGLRAPISRLWHTVRLVAGEEIPKPDVADASTGFGTRLVWDTELYMLEVEPENADGHCRWSAAIKRSGSRWEGSCTPVVAQVALWLGRLCGEASMHRREASRV